MSRIEDALRRAGEPISASATDAVDKGVPAAPVEIDVLLKYTAEEPVPEPIIAAAYEPDATTPDAPASPPSTPVDDKAEAAIRPVARKLSRKLILSDGVRPQAVEQYRKLAAVLHHLQAGRGAKVAMLASAVTGEGKTLTAANLALTLSESFHRRVLLVDADLRRPSLHRLFDTENAVGLNDGLKAEHDAKLPTIEITPRLSLLTAGRPNPDPMSSLTSNRMRRIIEEAAAHFDWVVLDTPPITLLPDANLLAEMADVVLFVVGAGTTPYHLVQRAVQAVDQKRIAGVVLNRVADASAAYRYHREAGAEQSAS